MTDLAMILGLINYVFVLFFGVVVSLYLADINFMDHKVLYFCTLLGFGAAEGRIPALQMLSTAHTCSIDSPDLACVSPEFLCFNHCGIICLSAVYTQKMVGHTGCLFLSRRSAHCQHNRNLCNDSFTFSGGSLYCTIHYPSEI